MILPRLCKCGGRFCGSSLLEDDDDDDDDDVIFRLLMFSLVSVDDMITWRKRKNERSCVIGWVEGIPTIDVDIDYKSQQQQQSPPPFCLMNDSNLVTKS